MMLLSKLAKSINVINCFKATAQGHGKEANICSGLSSTYYWLPLPLIPFVAMLWHSISISCHLDWHQIVINDGLGQAAMRALGRASEALDQKA